MPKKEIIASDKLSPGRALLSQATRFGDLVFVQGCTGRHPSTGEVGKDIKEQTRYALDRIQIILEAAGTSLDNVMANTCYVTRAEDLAGFNEVYAEYFTGDLPSRTAIIVNFGAADNLVEITSTACIPS
ncbi:MAG: RidA family protein [Dehalococcoidia bacterium]